MLPRDETFRFGAFTFSRVRGLYRGDEPVRLRHQERQLLKVLLDRAGGIVRKEELMAAVWGVDTNVSENTLNVLVRRLRETLNDARKPYRLLKSVSRMGYLLVATPLPRRVDSVEPATARGDRSRFVRDVTVPDGSLVMVGEQFEKAWEIFNAGTVAWRGRRLSRVGTSSGEGRLIGEPFVTVPDTNSGELCLIHTTLTAPALAGTCVAFWKMIDEAGRLCFPKLAPLHVNVDVVTELR